MLDDTPVTVQKIVAEGDVPERFIRLVMGQLAKAEYVEPTGQPDEWRLTQSGVRVFEMFLRLARESEAWREQNPGVVP